MTATPAETAGTETVAVLGAGGTMGFPVARNIARAGIPVRAWNRSRDKAEQLAEDGAYVAGTPADAARGAGIVITMLADGDAVTAAIDGPDGTLAVMTGDQGAARHALWIQLSTVGEAATKRCAELADRAGIGFVDAPVLGTRQPAEAGAGTRLKLVTNSRVLAVVEGTSPPRSGLSSRRRTPRWSVRRPKTTAWTCRWSRPSHSGWRKAPGSTATRTSARPT